MTLVEAIQSGSLGTLEQLLQGGTDVNQLDANGWTPLNWAAVAGDIAMAKLLVKFGASASLTGRDLRTPAMIAFAAGKPEVAGFLREAEVRNSSGVPERKYCMAVRVKQLQQFPGWLGIISNGTAAASLPDTAIVYLHFDYVVTRSVWRDGEVLLDKLTPEWKQFCETDLKFHVPGDPELIAI